MQTPANNLKPCPFCGNQDLQTVKAGKFEDAYCNDCGAQAQTATWQKRVVDYSATLLIGQRVIVGGKFIGVTAEPAYVTHGEVWVRNAAGHVYRYAASDVKPLPNGQF